jgi:hypothetical protein
MPETMTPESAVDPDTFDFDRTERNQHHSDMPYALPFGLGATVEYTPAHELSASSPDSVHYTKIEGGNMVDSSDPNPTRD